MKPKPQLLLLLISIIIFGCNSPKEEILLTFQVDMSKVINEIEDPKTVGIVGDNPLLARYDRKLMEQEGAIFKVRISIPDSLVGTRLRYAFVVDSFNQENRGYPRRQLLLPEKSTVLPVVEFNDLLGSTGDRISPSPPIPVSRANTPQEKAVLAEPFVGITNNGELQRGLFSIKSTGFPTNQIKKATETLLKSFSTEQLDRCLFDIEDDEWRRWHNIEVYERQGVALFEMSDKQKELAFKVLEESLSPSGLKKTKDIMAMEEYVKELSLKLGYLSKNRANLIGSEQFYFTFMGTPSETEPWGWQLDGHHLVINYFVLGDQIVMTPTFMGSEPVYIEDGPNKGVRTFEREEKKGLQLYRSLKGNQVTKATLLKEKKYNFAQAEAFKDNQIIPYTGIQANDLDNDQKEMLLDLIQEYVGNIREEQANVRMEEIEAHLENTWFSWVGGSNDDSPFYYRIHSPVILIEFDFHGPNFLRDRNHSLYSGPGKKHIHTVVRTPNGGDYGKDLLRQHLENHHH